jgi:proteasome lid subunit RPN8/RPN11
MVGRQRARRLGRVPEQSIPVFIHAAVLDDVLDFSLSVTDREVGGFLLGGLYRDRVSYVEVTEFLPAGNTIGAFSSLTFTHDTWALLNRQVEQRPSPTRVVGWHHTHPGLGVAMSRHDEFIHRNFFSLPWQVALVVDPRAGELALFQCFAGRMVNIGWLAVPAAAGPAPARGSRR